MNDKLKKYFMDSQKMLDDAKQAEREKVLSAAGLYDTAIEYAPDEICNNPELCRRAGYTSCVLVDGQYKFYRQKKIFFEISDEEYEKICALEQAKAALKSKEEAAPALAPMAKTIKQPEEYKIESDPPASAGYGAKYLKVLSWMIWIGGLGLAILTANVEEVFGTYYTYTETVFHWEIFFETLATYAVMGSLTMCASEMLDNINSIAWSVKKYRVRK